MLHAQEIIDRPLRPVAIPDDQRELFLGQLPLHGRKALCRRYAEDAFGGEIAPDRPADEVVRSGIANVLHDRRIDIAQIDEALGQARSLPEPAQAAVMTGKEEGRHG